MIISTDTGKNYWKKPDENSNVDKIKALLDDLQKKRPESA